MTGCESARAEWLPEIIAFSDSVFRRGWPGSMGDEFPLLFDAANAGHLFVHRTDGQVDSLVGAYPWELRLGGRAVQAASVGSVATAPERRGEGIASALLELAAERLRGEGCRLVLISGDLGLYRRFGAVEVGRARRLRLSSPPPVSSALRTLRVGAAELPLVAWLYDARPTRYVRSASEVERLFAAGGFAAGEQGRQAAYLALAGDEPRGYALAVLGPRRRPASLVCELAGDAEGVAACCAAALADAPGPLDVHVPSGDGQLATGLSGAAEDEAEPFPYLVATIDPDGLVADLGLDAPSLDAPALTEHLFSGDAPRLPFVWPEGLCYV